MPANQPRYSPEEHARRGDAIYDEVIGPAIESEHSGDFVLIDIESGAYEVDPSELIAADRLSARVPDGQIWLRRVGSRYARRIGPRPRGNDT